MRKLSIVLMLLLLLPLLPLLVVLWFEAQPHSQGATTSFGGHFRRLGRFASHTDSQQLIMSATEHSAEYDGTSVVEGGWGTSKATADECKAACAAEPSCNVWVFCHDPAGCGGRGYHECWLKRHQNLNPLKPAGKRGAGLQWVSGAKYRAADFDAYTQRAQAEQRAESDRLARLKANASLPLVYLDVAIKGQAIGRITMVLFSDTSPRAAENFRALCTGEKGIVPPGHEGEGKPYHFKGASFYRIIDRFIDQAGANTDSVFGGMFDDDAGGVALKHDRRGLLSMANRGPNTNTSHFSIMMGPAHHLDGSYTIFGEVVEGWDVAEQINALSVGQPDNTATAAAGVIITNSGQLR